MKPGGFIRTFEDDDYRHLSDYDGWLIQHLRNALKLRNSSHFYRVASRSFITELKDRKRRGVYPGCG